MAVADILKKIFGSKSDRDMKAIRPYLQKVLAAYPEIDALSADGLRERSAALRAKIFEVEKPFEDRIAEIKARIEEDIPIEEKEALATESDKLVKDEDEAIEVILNELLPEAFAIMKSTARRFAQNETVVVTASEFDKKLAAESRDFVEIDGDKAIWHNHWQAGGNEITWDMVHYDVQLIGGIVLNGGVKTNKDQRGMIAEMATGEGKTLVGLLMLLSRLNKGLGPCVYVSPNKQLAEQASADAKKFGIPHLLVSDGELPSEFLESKKLMITHVHKVFNGLTHFGLDNRAVKVGTFVLDDSHACIDAIRSSFTIQIRRVEPLFNILLKMFETVLRWQGEGSFFAIESNPFATDLLTVPYWSWIVTHHMNVR